MIPIRQGTNSFWQNESIRLWTLYTCVAGIYLMSRGPHGVRAIKCYLATLTLRQIAPHCTQPARYYWLSASAAPCSRYCGIMKPVLGLVKWNSSQKSHVEDMHILYDITMMDCSWNRPPIPRRHTPFTCDNTPTIYWHIIDVTTSMTPWQPIPSDIIHPVGHPSYVPNINPSKSRWGQWTSGCASLTSPNIIFKELSEGHKWWLPYKQNSKKCVTN